MKRNRYTQEFKQQVVQEATEVGNTVQVARRHDLNLKMVYQWVKQSTHQDWQATPAGAKKVVATLRLRKSCVNNGCKIPNTNG